MMKIKTTGAPARTGEPHERIAGQAHDRSLPLLITLEPEHVREFGFSGIKNAADIDRVARQELAAGLEAWGKVIRSNSRETHP